MEYGDASPSSNSRNNCSFVPNWTVLKSWDLYGSTTYCLKCVVQPEHATETWMSQAFRSSHCGNKIWIRYASGRVVLISSQSRLHRHHNRDIARY
jgi:hypothetical protein